MKMKDSPVSPAPPRLISSLVAGFDTITNHIVLILFPVGLDILLWFGPHFRLKTLISSFISDLTSLPGFDAPEMEEILQPSMELWSVMAEQFNLLTTLRSYPIGIPSLMVSNQPVRVPVGRPMMVDISTLGIAILLLMIFTVLGLILGALFFSLVAQATLKGEIRWRRALSRWPWMSLQVLLLALLWVGLMLVVSVPASCLLTFGALGGLSLGQFAILLYGGFMIWLIFPLLFSPHGIFVNRHRAWVSVIQGVRITNITIPRTIIFFLTLLLLSQGMDILWRIPPEDSWLTFIGIIGHAFVSTGLLAASFVYYRDADLWLSSLRARDRKSVASPDNLA
jgi:hypothetical protein